MPDNPYMDYEVDPRSRFRGKFSGVVENNDDPDQAGKLEVSVPEILSDGQPWARACVPYADRGHGFFMVPPIGARIWVEFEDGDIDRPIWTGCQWANGEAPLRDPNQMMISTPFGSITFNAKDPEAKILIKTGDNVITLSDEAVTLKVGKSATIEMRGSTTAINGDALEVN